MLWLALAGLGIGFFKSLVPTGPASIIVVRRGLERRYARGMAVALGGAFAELGYCTLAVFGLSILFNAHPDITKTLYWIGVVLLALLGGHFLLAKPRLDPEPRDNTAVSPSSARDFLLGLSITGLNPTMVFTWTAAVGVLVAVGKLSFAGWSKLGLPVGVLTGDILANGAVLLALKRWGEGLERRTVGYIVRAMGVVLIGIAGYAAYKGLF